MELARHGISTVPTHAVHSKQTKIHQQLNIQSSSANRTPALHGDGDGDGDGDGADVDGDGAAGGVGSTHGGKDHRSSAGTEEAPPVESARHTAANGGGHAEEKGAEGAGSIPAVQAARQRREEAVPGRR